MSDGSTWLGYLGAGGSAALIVGGGVYQFDLWNVGGKNLPTRVYVTSKKVGLIAHAGISHAMVLVTGASNQTELDNIGSSGIDWEFDIGASAKALKGVAKFEKYADLFAKVEKLATTGGKSVRTMTNWAGHESGKRLAQAAMGDFGVVQGSGPQFNVLPSPLSFGLGAGLVYDWQKMYTMGGKQAWSMISPSWRLENEGSSVILYMTNIPEQDGTRIKLAIGIDEWGSDPYIRWKADKGGPKVDPSKAYHILAYVKGGEIYHSESSELAGIDLGKLTPIGQLETGMTSVSKTRTINTDTKLDIYPAVMKFGNYPYWSADDDATVKVDRSGKFTTALSPGKVLD